MLFFPAPINRSHQASFSLLYILPYPSLKSSKSIQFHQFVDNPFLLHLIISIFSSMREEAEMAIPPLLRCPISLDLFRDPVTLCTGQTYDRSSIEKWLAAGNLTCPVTMQRLNDPSMVPNHTLRHLIDQWLKMGPQFEPQMAHPDPSMAALKHGLESHESTIETRLQTLDAIQVLSQESPSRNSCLVQLGFFPLLVKLVFESSVHETLVAAASAESDKGQMMYAAATQSRLKFAELALVCALKMLPDSCLGPLNFLKEESKLECFLALFDHGEVTIKTSLCQLVEAISLSSETKELGEMLGNNHGILQRLVLLLHNNSGASEAGIKAMSALCSLEPNKENLVREGVVGGLITYVLNAERTSPAVAMQMLERLLGLESANQAVNAHPEGVNALVKMVFRVSDHQGSESAVNALMILCSGSVQTRERAICAGVLTQLLLLLQSQCSWRTKTRARMLLKLLRSLWDEDLTNR